MKNKRSGILSSSGNSDPTEYVIPSDTNVHARTHAMCQSKPGNKVEHVTGIA